MKKNKSKSKKHSTSKKIRKELELKLADSFNEIVKSFGKSKKANKVIERFAKQLSKKITVSDKSDSITPFIKEEVTPAKKPIVKEAASKSKAPVKEVVE